MLSFHLYSRRQSFTPPFGICGCHQPGLVTYGGREIKNRNFFFVRVHTVQKYCCKLIDLAVTRQQSKPTYVWSFFTCATRKKKLNEALFFFYLDSRYYDCTIQEVTPNGYKVVFPAYGNVEEVPLEYLQKKVAVSSAKVGRERTDHATGSNQSKKNGRKRTTCTASLTVVKHDAVT